MSNRTAQRAIGIFLKSRRQLIVDLMRLSTAIESDLRDDAESLLERFCQQMVDYLSVGYFRVYGGLLSVQQTWATPREYAIFDSTTSTAMTFNDHHAGGDRLDVARIKTELATVALALETRFELEDELFNRTRETRAMAV